MNKTCITRTRVIVAAMITLFQPLPAGGGVLNSTFLRSERQTVQSPLRKFHEYHKDLTGSWAPEMTTASESTRPGESTVTSESSQKPRPGEIQQPTTNTPETARAPELRRITESTPQFRQGTENVEDPNGKTHLYLGTRETIECFNQTMTAGTDGVHDQFCIECLNPKPTHFYREILASKGYIVLKSNFKKGYLKNLILPGCSSVYRLGGKYQCYCSLRLQIPPGFDYMLIEMLENSGSEVQVYNGHTTKIFKRDFVATNNVRKHRNTHISLNSVSITQIVDAELAISHNRMNLRFEALPKQGLEVRRTAFNRGIGQTSFYLFPMMIKENKFVSCNITVPFGHVTMISFPRFELVNMYVKLFAGDKDGGKLGTFFPDEFDPSRASIYNTSLLVIQLHSYLKPFQFYFSFHNASALPVKLPAGSWNCSVPYLSDFLYHLSCNIEVECDNAADETDCSYTTDFCGPRYVTLGGACFFYVMNQKKGDVSWNTAYDICSVRGAQLASLNTVEKWTGALKLLPQSAAVFTRVQVGISKAPSTQPLWYKNTYQWIDTSSAFYLNAALDPVDCTENVRTCGSLDAISPNNKLEGGITIYSCNKKTRAHILCEKPMSFGASTDFIEINATDLWPPDNAYIQCPLGHYTHQFLACDVESSCWYRDHSVHCESLQSSFLQYFACTDQIVRVPYELVCDHRDDCVDGSDEDFCRFPPCLTGQFLCSNRQCIPLTKVNDGWSNCFNGDDEDGCFEDPVYIESVFPPALVVLTEMGTLVVRPLDKNSPLHQHRICPQTHFQCPGNGFCLPVILRCNGVNDCPGQEDEAGCDKCPGFYRCRASGVCIHHNDLCDGHAHCPQHDDELMCNSTCPPFCVCRGLTFFCPKNITSSDYPFLRYLDVSGSGVKPAHMTNNPFMIYLSLANCRLSRIDGLFLPNLLILNARDNNLKSFNHVHFNGVPQLRELSVAGNPLTLGVESVVGLRSFRHILKLDLSRVVMHDLNVTALSAFPNLHVLNVSDSRVQRVQGEGLGILQHLRVVDLRGCPMTWFPRGLFHSLEKLQVVYADNFRVCCSAVLPPDFNLHKCYTFSNEISSCEDLLRGKGYSVCVFVLALVAVAGNAISFIFRSYVSKREKKLGYGNFVTHLSVSDFLMGIYLAIIGTADQVFRGTYLWYDLSWRYSVVCKLAGVLSLLSSEVSSLILCLITLDRFLVLRFPFSQIHFSSISAHTASGVVWMCGIILVSLPLLPWTSSWDFYSQTSICIPLPTTRSSVAGYNYSFSILIVFNFVLFLIVSMGQLSIYLSIRANAMSVSNTTKKTKDLTIARRLITVAITDFMCWFPVGVMGLLAFNGSAIPGEVNVIVAIFVLPLNSAVNPCLYTLNIILERRSRAREDKLRALLLAQLKK